MTEPASRKDALLEPRTLEVILEIIERTHTGLREACLQQSDRDEKAKSIEWYRGGAQVLVGLKGEIETERLRREDAAKETPEETIDRNLDLIARNKNWQMQQAPEPDGEL